MHLIYFDESGQTGNNLRDPVQPARRREEQKAGVTVKLIDQGGIPLIEPLVHIGDERFRDVNVWLTAEQKKGRPGN